MQYGRVVALVTAALNLPFGYTLTIWSSASITSVRFGQPNLPAVFAFLLGAIGAYFALALFSVRYLGSVTAVRMRKATLANIFPVVAAAAVYLTTQLAPSPAAAFLIAGFTSTLVYILSLATLTWLAAR